MKILKNKIFVVDLIWIEDKILLVELCRDIYRGNVLNDKLWKFSGSDIKSRVRKSFEYLLCNNKWIMIWVGVKFF